MAPDLYRWTRPLEERLEEHLSIIREGVPDDATPEEAWSWVRENLLADLLRPQVLHGCLAEDHVALDLADLWRHVIEEHPELDGEAFEVRPAVDGVPGYATLPAGDDGSHRIRCRLCGMETSNDRIIRNFYEKHAKGCYREHKNRPTHVCGVDGCDFGARTRDDLAEHLAEVHPRSDFVLRITSPERILAHLEENPGVDPYRDIRRGLDRVGGHARAARVLDELLAPEEEPDEEETDWSGADGGEAAAAATGSGTSGGPSSGRLPRLSDRSSGGGSTASAPVGTVPEVRLGARDRDLIVAFLRRVGSAVPSRVIARLVLQAACLGADPTGDALARLEPGALRSRTEEIARELRRHLKADPTFREEGGDRFAVEE